jgi:hypothetical protein
MTITDLTTYLDRNAYRAGSFSECLRAAASLAAATNNFTAQQDETTLRHLNGAYAHAMRFYDALNPSQPLNVA